MAAAGFGMSLLTGIKWGLEGFNIYGWAQTHVLSLFPVVRRRCTCVSGLVSTDALPVNPETCNKSLSLSSFSFTVLFIVVHYLQQRVNLNCDRSHLFLKSILSHSRWKYEAGKPQPMWHISSVSCSLLGLIFSLMHQFSPACSLSASCYRRRQTYFPRGTVAPSVFCYSFWRAYLNGKGFTLTIRRCLHICQSVPSLIFYLCLFCAWKGHRNSTRRFLKKKISLPWIVFLFTSHI